jgi:signal transduction histidine kinase/ActR/RegA family two-component response regulator
MARAAQGQPQILEWQARSRDGRLFWVEVTMHSAPVGGEQRLLVSLRDIDERKKAAADKQRLEDQLRQAQKLESIGRLAGGVAHDFNNLLTSVLGNVELAMALIPAAHPLMENLEEIRHAARRSADLTGQLLAFSRKQPIAPIPIDTKNVLGSVERMLRRLLGETIELRSEIAPDVGRIRADPGQIEQILVNLAVNARDAMPEGGRLTIVAENTTLDDSFRAAHPNARLGEFVRLSMTDTGTGMTAEVQQHIFEPFFTTKTQGKGTGLGLAMVFGAVEQNRGFILVRSEAGHGSSFDLYFPRFLGRVEDGDAEARGVALPTGTEHILLVEDDDLVRHLSQRVLERQGYRVLVCGTGAEAMAAGQKDGSAFDLLVTDLILPDVDGRKLAKQLWDLRPDLRVLYCSGYTEDVIAHRGAVDEGLAFLAKPFTAEGLARKVRAVLDSPATASRPG